MKKLLKGKSLLIVITLFIVGLLIRNIYTNKLAINFMYDQARDMFLAKEIIQGDFKIQGPSANAPGLYHGVMFLYFIAIPYFISSGSPLFTTVWLSVFSSLTIIITYYLALSLTNDKRTAFISALFFTFSFEASQYALWLSNPSMAVWFVPLTYFCLWLWTKRKNTKFAFLTGLFFGFSLQSNLFLIYHFLPILIWLIINRKRVNKSQIFGGLAGILLGVSSLIVSEIKFGFKGFEGLSYILRGGDSVASSKTFSDFVLIYLGQLNNVFSLNIYPTSRVIAAVIGLISILLLGKKYRNFLLLYLFSHVSIVSLGGFNTPYIMVGIGSAVCIIVAIFISKIYSINKLLSIVLIIAILVSNLTSILQFNKYGQTIFAIRSNMLLPNLLDAVDYTYLSSGGQRFSINTVTAPLWLNTTWSALYNWYGLKNYGHLPYWHGRDQVGYWGDNLERSPNDTPFYYLIIEPSGGILQRYIKEAVDDENSFLKVVEEKNFDGIIVQKRIKKQN